MAEQYPNTNHRREAERLLEAATREGLGGDTKGRIIAAAQVHATLAVAQKLQRIIERGIQVDTGQQ